MDNLIAVARRILLLAALGLAGLAVVEGALQLGGASLTSEAYTAGRLLEFSGIIMVLAIGLQLREIRQDLRRKSG